MPRTFGDSLVHKSHVDIMVEVDYPLPELKTEEPNQVEKTIGKLIAQNLVEDGATLQMGKPFIFIYGCRTLGFFITVFVHK